MEGKKKEKKNGIKKRGVCPKISHFFISEVNQLE